MKTTVILAAALAGLASVPQTASAGRNDKVWIAAGSFVGGVIIGSHLQHRDPPPTVVYCPPPPPPCPPPQIIYSAPPPPPPPSGYWKTIQTRVYVPARWVATTDTWGRQTSYWQQAYYTYDTRRVWVETGPGACETPGSVVVSESRYSYGR